MDTGEKPRTAYKDNITKDLQLIKFWKKAFKRQMKMYTYLKMIPNS